MKYDFDTVIDRRNTDSEKWRVEENELPMWVADMDLAAAPEIVSALQARLSHGVFGYSFIPDRWYDAYIGWWKGRHGFAMEKDWLVFCTGVVPALSSIVRKLTTPGENVLVQTPVYNMFFNSVLNNGRRLVENPLIYENGAYAMDFDDLERKLSDPQTALMILCNPQNPAGKIWDADTLARVGALCKKHHVIVVSDEIHCDIAAPGTGYVPFASVSPDCRDNSVTCIAPTKCFNLAGMHTAAVSVPDPVLRHKVWRALNTDEIAEPGALAVPAAVAAFEQGGPWLDEMREYVFENRRIAAEFMEQNIPGMVPVAADATYLMWLDIRAICPDSRRLAAFIRRETGLFLTAGAVYGDAGEGFFRFNVACPRALLMDGLSRLQRGVELFRAQK